MTGKNPTVEMHMGKRVIPVVSTWSGERCKMCAFDSFDSCDAVPCMDSERMDGNSVYFIHAPKDEIANDVIKTPTLANAASIVIETTDGLSVLTATRRHSEILALPGGKQDLGETILETVVREVSEETGLYINPLLCIPVYSAIVDGADGHNFYCTTYLYAARFDARHFLSAWQVEDGITVSFKTWDALLNWGAFKEYNTRLKQSVDVARKTIPVL